MLTINYKGEKLMIDLNKMFKPESVAVIGASNTPGKVGYIIVDNLINDGFKGEIYPVNPKGGEILGKKAYANITEIPGNVDLAIITIPSPFVNTAVEECGEKGVENMVGAEAVKEFNLNPKLHFGDIASGDQFINSNEKRNEILGLLPDVLCVEMEGAAVAQVCLEFNTPFTVIRTISDTADHNARVDFGKFIVEVANAYSRAIIGEIVRLV